MEYAYKLIRSDRKTVSLQILADGSLLVRCPRKMSAQQVQAFVDSKRNWIQKHLSNQPEPLPTLTHAQMQKFILRAKEILPPRVAYFAQMLGVSYGRITIRNQRTRWGSCSSKGNLNFNFLLVLVPAEVRDYVVVHELCHLKEMNHSKDFWNLVEGILPDYRTHRKWLKAHGSALIASISDRG